MKDMLEIVRKAMVLKKEIDGKNPKKDSVIYIDAQLQILEFIINKDTPPEDSKEELIKMYINSIDFHFKNNSDGGDKTLLIQVRGSADILSWILGVPTKINELNKVEGHIGNYVFP